MAKDHASLQIGRLLYPEALPPRPRTRGECVDGPRPCPWVGCRHHLFLEVTDRAGVTLRHPHLEPWDLEHSCSLDVADLDGASLQEVGDLENRSRQRVQQTERGALVKLEALLARLRHEDDEDEDDDGGSSASDVAHQSCALDDLRGP